MVLFADRTPQQRADEPQIHAATVRRLTRGFRQQGMLGLLNGSIHVPKQLANRIAALQLSFEVRTYWLPAHASWLDQVEIIFTKVQRDALTPNDFSNLKVLEKDLMAYFDELNHHPKPIKWPYTKPH